MSDFHLMITIISIIFQHYHISDLLRDLNAMEQFTLVHLFHICFKHQICLGHFDQKRTGLDPKMLVPGWNKRELVFPVLTLMVSMGVPLV